MTDQEYRKIAAATGLQLNQVTKTAALLEDGASVPFIARYRKEATGGLDETGVIKLRDAIEALKKINQRRESIMQTLREREVLTPELERQLNDADTLDRLEDIYLPYKVKRKTRAAIAREKGLAPLAEFLLAQNNTNIDLKSFISAEKGVTTKEEALQGAMDIVAETINEDAIIRSTLRDLFRRRAFLESKVVKSKIEAAAVFKDYFDYAEAFGKIPSHRALAVLRGQAQEMLTVHLRPDKAEAVDLLTGKVIRNPRFNFRSYLELTVEDAWNRLLMPSLENEFLNLLKERADQEAIRVFASNVHQLLLEAPLGQKVVMAIDPGIRTGCKTAVLNAQGTLLEHFVIYPQQNESEAAAKVRQTCQRRKVEAIAIGNGTAGRETEAFAGKAVGPDIPVISVNESGASIYSAGEVARAEFPDLDLTFRSAVSIGRRLQDPLAELIKIDPKSIGVGQYQHDVDQTALKLALDDVVMSCVNAVGVELNSASIQLLSYVSGLGPKLAGNIVEYRNTHGAFKRRRELLEVKGLGPKAFEQCAGFLRIRDAADPLDASAVHPERYALVRKMAADQSCSVAELMRKAAAGMEFDLKRYVDAETGLPTLRDIVAELARPGRDPRPEFEPFAFADTVHSIEDLKEGMKLPGIVTNVTKFGAFVDIGVHQDGLLHISRMARRYISDPQEVVTVHDRITVTVVEIDSARKRISLSLID